MQGRSLKKITSTYSRAFANFFKLFFARWRLIHSFLKTSVAQIQNFRSIRPKITLQRAQNKKQRPNTADRPNLAVLKPSKAEPSQPYVWSYFFQNLDSGYWYLKEAIYQSQFWSKKMMNALIYIARIQPKLFWLIEHHCFLRVQAFALDKWRANVTPTCKLKHRKWLPETFL